MSPHPRGLIGSFSKLAKKWRPRQIPTTVDAKLRRPRLELLEARQMLTCGGSVSIVSTVSFNENVGTAAVTATLAGASCGGGSATVAYSISGGTAATGVDFTGSTTGTLTFSASSSTANISFSIVDDGLNEGNETFTISLNSPTNTTVASGSSTTTVTITDNDGTSPTGLTVRIAGIPSFSEGTSGATSTVQIPVSLFSGTASATASTAVTVEYEISPATATTPADFTVPGGMSGTLTLGIGTSTTNLAINIIGDNIDEWNESLILTLKNPTNASVISGGTASTTTVIIPDDDGPNPVDNCCGYTLDVESTGNSECAVCNESTSWYATSDAYDGSYSMNLNYLLSDAYGSSSALDLSSFALPVYDTSFNPYFSIASNVELPSGYDVPDSFEVYWTFHRADGATIQSPTRLYSNEYADSEEVDPGVSLTFSAIMNADATSLNLPIGYTTYDTVVTGRFGSNTATLSSSGGKFVPTRQANYSGWAAAWSIPELDRLYLESPDGSGNYLRAVLVRGDGSTTWFTRPNSASAFVNQVAGSFSTLAQVGATYVLTNKYKEKTVFDSTGKITKRIDPQGNDSRVYEFAVGTDRLASITDLFERETTYADMNTDGYIDKVTDFAGREIAFAYENGRIDSVTLPDPGDGEGEDSLVIGLDYYSGTENGYKNGLMETISYSVTLAEGDSESDITATIDYDDAGKFSSFTLEREYESSVVESSTWYLDSSSSSSLLSEEGYVGWTSETEMHAVLYSHVAATRTDELGNQTTYYFDCLGNVTQVLQGYASTIHYDRDPLTGLIDSMVVNDPDGGGPLGNLTTTFDYDSYGNLEEIHYAAGFDGVSDSEYRTYDAVYGLIESYTDETGHTSLFDVDDTTGLIDSVTQVVGSVGGGDDVVASFTYTSNEGDLPDGLLQTSTDRYGVVTQYDYFETTPGDAKFGRLMRITYNADPDEGESSIEVLYDYDQYGNLSSYTDGEGNATRYFYDRLGRLTRIIEAYPDMTVYEQVDDGDADFDTDGSWDTISGGHGNDYRVHASGAGDDYATWTFEDLVPGKQYEVFMTWDDDTLNSNAVPVTIDYGGLVDAEHSVNQKVSPGTEHPFDGETEWQSVGKYILSGTTLTVKLEQTSTGKVVADAVRLVEAAPETTLTYNELASVLRITDAMGVDTRYAYNARFLTTEILQADPAGGTNYPTTQLIYDTVSRVKAAIDPLDNRTDFVWDSVGRLTNVKSPYPDANPASWPTILDNGDATYVGGGSWTSDSQGYGSTRKYGQAAGLTASWSFGELVPGKRYEVVVTWDNTGISGTLNAPFALFDGAVDGSPDYQVIVNQQIQPATHEVFGAGWHSIGSLIVTGDSLSVRLATGSGTSGNVIADAVRLIEARPETTYEYDGASNVRKVTDPMGNFVTYSYDSRHRLISTVLPDPDGLSGQPTYKTRYNAASEVIAQIDPLNRVTRFEYDDLGRMITARMPHPAGATGAILVDKQTPPTDWIQGTGGWDGNYIHRTGGAGSVSWGSNTLENATEYEILATWVPDETNGALQAPFAIDPSWAGVSTVFVNQAAAPADGDVFGEGTSVKWQSLGHFKTPTDGTNSISVSLSTVTGKKVIADAVRFIKAAPKTTYGYQDDTANHVTVTDPLGHATVYAYDDFYRLVQRTDPDPETAANAPVTVYAYDDAHNLISLTDPVNNTTHFQYDALRRLVGEKITLTGIGDKFRTFHYDAVGKVVRKEDRNGRKTDFVYDVLYRLTSEKWLDGVGDVIHTLSYGYDDAGQLTSVDDNGVDSHYDYLYDGLGRVTHWAVDNFDRDYAFDSAFNANGRRVSLAATIESTKDFVNTYRFDKLNRMMRVDQAAQDSGVGYSDVAEKRVDFTYNLAGQFNTITRYKDTDGGISYDVAKSTFGYDRMGRMTDLLHEELDGTASNIVDYGWTFDAASRIKQFVSSIDGTIDYDYDNTNQLIEEDDGSTPVGYAYDENGNRTTAAGESYTDDPAGFNRVKRDGTYEYEYDAEGNMTKRIELVDDEPDGETIVFTWDHRNRLVALTTYDDATLTTKTKEVFYEYDPFDRRIRKRIDNDGVGGVDETHEYVYDGDAIVLALDGSGDLKNRYLHGPAVDMILADEQISTQGEAGTVYWPLTDHLGTVRDLVNNNGTVVNHVRYDGFGNITAESGPSSNHIYGFTGREHDEESHLQFNRARYYDAAIGRWISEDPIGFTGGDGNTQRYVGNTPTSYRDPSGLVVAVGPATGPDLTYDPKTNPNFAIELADALEKQGFKMVWGKSTVGGRSKEGGDTITEMIWEDCKGNQIRIVVNQTKGAINVDRVRTELDKMLDGAYMPFGGVIAMPRWMLGLYGGGALKAGGGAVSAILALAIIDELIRMSPLPAPIPWPGDDRLKGPPGTEWRGKPGSRPGDVEGNYYNPRTGESWWPDLDHAPPIGPHWDYVDPNGGHWRVFPDGRVEPK